MLYSQQFAVIAVIANALCAAGSVVGLSVGEFAVLHLVFAFVVHGAAAEDHLIVAFLSVNGHAPETICREIGDHTATVLFLSRIADARGVLLRVAGVALKHSCVGEVLLVKITQSKKKKEHKEENNNRGSWRRPPTRVRLSKTLSFCPK